MTTEPLADPDAELEPLGPWVPDGPVRDAARRYAAWWIAEGDAISAAIDRAGTPALRTHDALGQRVDEILYPPEYWRMLQEGYRAGAVWRAFEGRLRDAYAIGHVTAHHDPGLYCPHIVSLSTAAPLKKYGEAPVVERFLPGMLHPDETVQGATWMTEIGGGSDLGAGVRTVARRAGDRWTLTGEKYFCSNAGAGLAVVAARPQGAPEGVRGLALFLVPRRRDDGALNYVIRRLKPKMGTRSVPTGEIELNDADAYLLGAETDGIYLILEVLNLSRVANSVGAAALAQRALALASHFADRRVAFGKPIGQHPMLAAEIESRRRTLREATALAWRSVELLEEVWQQRPPYDERYHQFRLVAHLAKYWTADVASDFARWCMIVHGGNGVIEDYPAERLLREALVLEIWEGTPHRQVLDGLEAMERKRAHEALLADLADRGAAKEAEAMGRRLEDLLELPRDDRERRARPVFEDLARLTARVLAGPPGS